jgi:hypothetical protein
MVTLDDIGGIVMVRERESKSVTEGNMAEKRLVRDG